MIRRMTGVRGPLEVVDLRSFEDPSRRPRTKGYLLDIQRWYVKAFAEDDLSFQGRFLVESREFGTGLVAVAPYDTNGFRSPDWAGFQFDSGDRRRGRIRGCRGCGPACRTTSSRVGRGSDPRIAGRGGRLLCRRPDRSPTPNPRAALTAGEHRRAHRARQVAELRSTASPGGRSGTNSSGCISVADPLRRTAARGRSPSPPPMTIASSASRFCTDASAVPSARTASVDQLARPSCRASRAPRPTRRWTAASVPSSP